MNTSVNIAGVEWKNPVTTSSGTFGSGEEYSDFFDLSELGAVTTKGVARVAWPGNDTPRVCETPSGMMNAIGLQNPGVDVFKERDLPFLSKFDTKIIVNVCGHTIEEYEEVVEKLNDTNADMFEINISCPNVQSGGMAFGQDRDMVEIITQSMKKRSKKPIIMKLSPNVGDIADMARAAEAGGADAISLVNTFLAMKIDINKRKFALANRTGGLSGPAIRPIAVRMVYDAAHAVKIPVIGMGGIQTSEDALEFIMAGATAVSVGTATFSNPLAARDVAVGIKNFMVKNKVEDIKELIGCVSQ
ncbi:MAG TPA: dihydroorotate dehydrogenase [Lachnospiraceae bacterium]|jgi:dihydroorotate dehydrogenase (NAD+) catalytic subunit|nr:dihydroorotate dehydrogenase [Lachnospiraceae bacterium]HBZ89456.1 dihydroorotate dehydrogenase [Lachnospiraceae bacterium]